MELICSSTHLHYNGFWNRLNQISWLNGFFQFFIVLSFWLRKQIWDIISAYLLVVHLHIYIIMGFGIDFTKLVDVMVYFNFHCSILCTEKTNLRRYICPPFGCYIRGPRVQTLQQLAAFLAGNQHSPTSRVEADLEHNGVKKYYVWKQETGKKYLTVKTILRQ